MNDFNLRKYLTENKLTSNSRMVDEAKERVFNLEIIGKDGKTTKHKVTADPSSTELFRIIADLKKSPNVKDVKIIESENKLTSNSRMVDED